MKVEVTNPIKLGNDTPLKIELIENQQTEEEVPPSKNYFRWVIIAVSSITLAIILYWEIGISSRKNHLSDSTQSLRYCITHPTYIAPNQEGIIQVSLSNISVKKLEGLEARLIYPTKTYPKKIPLIIHSPDGNTVIGFGNLEKEQTKTKKINFLLSPSFKEREIKIILRILSKSSREIEIDSPLHIITSLWSLQKVINYLFVLVGIFIMTLVRKQAEKLVDRVNRFFNR
jgi:hypothetical protein